MRRNLLYNCCAFEWSEEWRLNVEKLNEYAGAFTGRRLVLLRVGPNLVSPEVVRSAFKFDVEFLEVPNDPVEHESAGLQEAWATLYSLDPNEATFYAHTKGVRYAGLSYVGKVEPQHMHAIRLWRNTMYEQCLQDTTRIDHVLERYACCGCYKRPFMLTSWAFHGSFYWLRHDALFKANWRPPSRAEGGTEAFPARLFPAEMGYCLYEDPDPKRCLYRAEYPYRCLNGHLSKHIVGIGFPNTVPCPSCTAKAIWV